MIYEIYQLLYTCCFYINNNTSHNIKNKTQQSTVDLAHKYRRVIIMSMSAALMTGLFANRVQTDLEYKLQCISFRKQALTDLSNEVGVLISNACTTPDTTDETLCQAALFIIQDQGKDLDTKMLELQTELKEYREIKESALKRAKEDAKESFTISA